MFILIDMMNYFTEQNFRIAWNQCRKYNYNNYNNFGLKVELEFYDKHIEIIIKDIIRKITSKSYIFSNKYIVYIPKDNGLLRRISIATFEDQLVMQVILNAIGYKLDKKFINTSYGNRLENKKGKLSTYIFKPYHKQFNKFINTTVYNIERGYNWICETDLTAYFDTINHEKLDYVLIENLNMEETQTNYMKDLIMDFIKKDVLENGEKIGLQRGIPQSMPISSFIGNLYLNDVDYEMIKNQDILYFRYVDDIRILGKSKKVVEDALSNLQKIFLIKELNINDLKTKIYQVDLNTINKEKLKHLQKEKLSIETVTENDFEDIRKWKNNDLSENDIYDIKTNKFNELEGMIKRKNKLIKHYLIRKNEKKNFKYIEEIISESPKYYYLVQNIKKYRNKISTNIMNKTYTNLVKNQYDVISAQGIADVLNYKELHKIKLDIAKVDNPRVISILLQQLTHKDYIKLLIRKSLKINNYSLNIILKSILVALSNLDISDKLKIEILNKLIKQEILLRDSYIFIYILFKDLIRFEKINTFIMKNYKYIYNKSAEKSLPTDNIYTSIKQNALDPYTIKNIIKKIVINLPNEYIKKPSLINPYNINVILGEEINIEFSKTSVNLKNKIPEDFIMQNGNTELKITYMIGIMWFCMFVKDSIKIYNNIVPYLQFSPISYWKSNKHEFTNKSFNPELLKNELYYIGMSVRKSPLNRMNIEKILKVKIGRECEEKIMQDNKTSNINILHLSDIHFGIEPTTDGIINSHKIAQRKLVLQRLINTLKNIDLEWKPNIIVISGDIGWRGKKEDYIEAKIWLEKLMKTLNISSEQLVICAGNHDLDRGEAEGFVRAEDYKDADKYLEKDNIVNKLQSCFKEYEAFANDIGIKPYEIGSKKGYLCGTLEIENIKFIVLNSAWFSRDNDDRGKLWIGLPMLEILEANNQISQSDEHLCIGLLHHPNTWLADEEIQSYELRTCTYDYLAEMTNLILSGHVHANPKQSDTIAGSSYLILSGSTYSKPNYSNNCSIIKINKENMTFQRTVVEYKPEERCWNIRYKYEEKDLVRKG